MKNQPTLTEYTEFFAEVSEPTMKSSADLRALQESRRKYSNPESFLLSLNPRPPIHIIWSFNTEHHLGCKRLDRKTFLGMFHPKWFSIFMAGSFSVLKIYRRVSGEQYKPEQSLNLMVPIRQLDGSYWWYNMYAIPGAFDAKGKLTRHFDVFLRICPFDDLFPIGPKIFINGESKPEYTSAVKQAIEVAFVKELKEILTPSGYKILQAYRTNCEFLEGKWQPLSHHKMVVILGKSRQALDRANVRLLQSARQMFPTVALTSVPVLAASLNTFCGKPVE